MQFARRLESVAAFRVMTLLEAAQAREAAGHDVIHLEVGEPDFPTPAAVIAAGQAALAAGQTRYTPACGLPALREAIAADYQRRHGVTVSPSRIIITPGASGALLLATLLCAERGDSVLMADPTYPCNRHFMGLVDAQLDVVPVSAASGWQLTAELADDFWRENTRAVMVASPSNPTGHVLSPEELKALGELCQSRDAQLLVDEIYQGLTYGVPAHTALAECPDAFVINSFSKYFGMTGWRLGWLVAPEAAVEPLSRLAQNVFLAASTPAQHAALAAFTPECETELERRRQVLEARRGVLLDGLERLGLAPSVPPQGAFYVWLDISHLSDDSEAFCRALLEEENVAITPGTDFALAEGRRHVRIAFTADEARLREALARMERFLERRVTRAGVSA
ncbi:MULTISPECIES: aminotransferase class I/II-fold pyridoxal phosphate-dependent enzyme [Cobetia]|uniref:aminotransferase class I/II-fold pyridoxal phosphate-dependent enzyme n=1 Tax=Cobetia TaxID=204286 RepID=UPI0015831417|nr:MULTISPECIES: aminotransferase class I/II-fold pyridoxal phosphate-dependent enzyme [Cobetia]MDI4661274.1 aminotransferase class I/II-fold pyridoxal phosphate-dependent enzyme [Cobetia sp. BMC6]MDL2190744.1 aminotransferase class I/II-fold pyridoxal phosphate-dependent enzyme [Cobetia sp. LC6]NUJ55960.1 aminotransferase class I/II-fold pyridoxal phosphate-dependent enzyme [Cobetia marina]